MNLYEYEVKELFRQARIPVPAGEIVRSLKDIPHALKKLGNGPWVLKAQILAGGRGKAGGVQRVGALPEAKKAAASLLGQTLVTAQTGPIGERAPALLIEKAVPSLKKELYAGVTWNRTDGRPTLLLSQTGGVDIETLSLENPSAVLRLPLICCERLPLFQARRLAHDWGLKGEALSAGAELVSRLVDLFFDSDATLLEINPLVLTGTGALIAVDGKAVVDDNALYRHPEFVQWRNTRSISKGEKRAMKAGISYVPLEGSVGCLVNGAGLAMATMDLIKGCGGDPANFLDVGGSATAGQVSEAFKIILSDKKVRGILVNIFGGIMSCRTVADGVVAAVKETTLKVPLVVRLEGNHAEEGMKILADSKLSLVACTSLSEAAGRVVQLSRK